MHMMVVVVVVALEERRICDGNSGLDLALGEEYDVMVLDLMLPGIDGLEICRQVRKSNIHTPILILTAKSQIKDKVLGLDTGADDYLTKPFSFEELVARIRALIRRPKDTISNVLTVEDLVMDLSMHKVTRNNQEVVLSVKEFALLEYLMRNKGRVLSKDQILTHVWNYESDVLPNTIEVYIKNLRTKIDNNPDKKLLIQTVRGFGYKVE
jgi:DNA-binding response OmpR family regulator